MNSFHALSQSFTIAGYLAPHFSAMSSDAALAAFALTHGLISSNGRADQSLVSCITLSVIREIVSFDTDAP